MKVERRYTIRYTNYLGTANKICYVQAHSKMHAWCKADVVIKEKDGYYPKNKVVESVLYKNGRVYYFDKEA